MGIQKIGLKTIGVNRAKSGTDFSWDSYWTTQSEVLFFGEISKIRDGKLHNQKKSATDYLTVSGSAGSYTFQAPNTAAYKSADTDYIWFRTDGTLRTITEAELVGYDIQKTPVKYSDSNPNSIECVMVLNESLTGAKRDRLFRDFHLPVFWDNSFNSYGVVKSNRGGSQQPWIAENLIPTGLTLTALSDTSIKFDWSNITGLPDNYKIERSVNGIDFTQIDTATAKTYTDIGLTQNTHYWYRIRYYNGSFNSGYSSIQNTWTATLLTLAKTGTGSVTGVLRVQFSENVVLTLDGSGYFYSDSGGTQDQSQSWNVNAATSGTLSTRYIKVTSGTSKLLIFHKNTWQSWGNSGNDGWAGNGTYTNAPSCTITDITRCTNLVYITLSSTVNGSIDITGRTTLYSARFDGLTTVTGDLTNLTNLSYLRSTSSGTQIVGDIGSANMVNGITYFYLTHCRLVDYTSGAVWSNATVTITPDVGYGYSSVEVDNILIDMANSKTLSGKTIDLRGANAARTAASDAAVATLTTLNSGYTHAVNTVYTN